MLSCREDQTRPNDQDDKDDEDDQDDQEEGRSPEIYTERDGVTWIFFSFPLLYSCLILPTPINAPLTMIKYHLGQAPRLFFFTSNELILKYCECHTVAFFVLSF